jgi:hypothetical protein
LNGMEKDFRLELQGTDAELVDNFIGVSTWGEHGSSKVASCSSVGSLMAVCGVCAKTLIECIGLEITVSAEFID